MAHHHSWPMRRPLADDERRLIRALLTSLGPEVDQGLIRGLERMEVVGQCGCGCPSIDLASKGAARQPVAGSRIVARAEARTPAGVPVGVILWARNGTLTGLEVHPWDATTSFGLPVPDSLTAPEH